MPGSIVNFVQQYFSMKEQANNIFTIYDETLQRQDKEALLNQRGVVVWMTGLSGSGKSTIAMVLERMLHQNGYLCQLNDGDNIRHGLNNNLGFSLSDRRENIRRIAEVNKLFLNCGIISINCFVSPTLAIRQVARDIVGEKHFVEVFVDTPLDVCEQRDVKGLYKKARAGEIKNFTGIDAPFEPPISGAIVLRTANRSPQDAADELYQHILEKIKYP